MSLLPPSRLPVGVLVLVDLLLSGCGGSSEEPAEGRGAGSARSEGAPQALANPAPERPTAPEQVFAYTATERSETYLRLREEVAPEHGGWTEEVAAGGLEDELEGALQAALEGDASRLEILAAPGAQAQGELRPSSPRRARDSTGVSVLRWNAAEDGDGRAVDEAEGLPLVDACAELCAPYASATGRRADVAVTAVGAGSGGGWTGEARLRLAARRGAASVQTNLCWEVAWGPGPDGSPPVVTSVVPLSFEELELERVPFAELTAHVLGQDPFFGRDLWLGSVEYEHRYDRLAGTPGVFLGMQGMAVGDVDGDGLEDLYVGQQAGVPNRLFLHQPDGSVRDVAHEAGVDFLDETGGVLLLDVDGDGARDVVLGRGPDIVIAWSAGGARFTKLTVLRGRGPEQVYSIAAADPDVDGDLDLYATRYVQGGVAGGVPTPYHDAENGATNLYWRNEGGRTFREAADEVGLGENNSRFSLAALWEDVDADGDLDLYVTNDFGRNNLYENDGTGRFTDVADRCAAADMAAGMGISSADVDGDGDTDLYVTNMFSAAGCRVSALPRFMPDAGRELRAAYERHARGNTLLLNRGDGTFEDASIEGGVAPVGWAWGAIFTDFDSDGWADIIVPSGFLTGRRTDELESFFWRSVIAASPPELPASDAYRDAWAAISELSQVQSYSWNGREPNGAYWNLGDGHFADAAAALGLDYRDDGRVACAVDWDGDGRLDLWLKNRTAPLVRFVHGRFPDPGGWIAFELEGRGGNREAIGAEVEVEAGGRSFVRRRYAGEGYLGSSTARLHFGIGGASVVDRVRVTWPDGEVEEHEGLAAGALWRLGRGSAPTRLELPAHADLHAVPERRLPERLPESPGTRVDQAPEQVSRVPVLDTLPCGGMKLDRFETGELRVADFAGRSLLVVLFGGWDDVSLEAVRRLAAASGELDAAEVSVHALSMDGVRDEAWVRSFLAEVGLSGGRLERGSRFAIELVLFELLGASREPPLPLGLLFDARGQIVCLYLGEVAPDRVARDASLSRIGLDGPTSRWRTSLTGGRWIDGGPSREIKMLKALLRRAGHNTFSADLLAEESRR